MEEEQYRWYPHSSHEGPQFCQSQIIKVFLAVGLLPSTLRLVTGFDRVRVLNRLLSFKKNHQDVISNSKFIRHFQNKRGTVIVRVIHKHDTKARLFKFSYYKELNI